MDQPGHQPGQTFAGETQLHFKVRNFLDLQVLCKSLNTAGTVAVPQAGNAALFSALCHIGRTQYVQEKGFLYFSRLFWSYLLYFNRV